MSGAQNELIKRGYDIELLRKDFTELDLKIPFDEWLAGILKFVIEEEKEGANMAVSRFFCKPCLDKGHQCYAIDGAEFDTAEDAVCRFCDDGEDCPVTANEKRKLKKIEEPPITTPKPTALATTKPAAVIPVSEASGEFKQDARDLMKILSQTMAGVLCGDVDPARANAVCNTANTVLKIATAVQKFK